MIITRSPFRISLGGGGTDLASYYQEHEGFLVAAAIDKYMYITIHKTFIEEMIIKYSKMERVDDIDKIEHPIIRESLKLLDFTDKSIEISSMADIPACTGLGSSGSFSTALLLALHRYKGDLVHPKKLAEEACHVEIDLLRTPCGKQDQYIAAYGGITSFHFARDGSVTAKPVNITNETLYNLEDNLVLFFTGFSRSASSILKEQDDKTKEAKSSKSDNDMVQNLHYVKELSYRSLEALESGNLAQFGKLMDEHWQHKKKRSGNMSNAQIDAWYALAMKNGAIGGKLVGAGGGGFLMFYTEDKVKLRHALTDAGMREVRFRFDFEGSKVLNT